MPGVREEVFRGRPFHDPSQVHHRDLVAEVAHHAQVVGDEEHRQPQGGPQVEQELQDLGLDRHVERGEGLIGDQQLGLHRQRPRDADPLPLSSGELPGVLVGIAGAQPDLGQEVGHPLPPLPRRSDLVHVEDLQQRVANGLARVERCVRVLEDDLHSRPERDELSLVESHQVDPAEPHLPFVGLVQS